MVQSRETMAAEKVAVYARPNKFVPNGFPLEVAKRKAKAAWHTFADAIDRVTAEDVARVLQNQTKG